MTNTPKAGFTLIELMVTVSVIVILTAVALPTFSTIGSNQTLVQTAENIRADIKGMQGKAIAGAVSGTGSNPRNGYWGVRFTGCNGGKSTAYLFGQPSDYTDPLSTISSGRSTTLAQGVFVNCPTGGDFQVVFDKLSGVPVVNPSSVVVSDGAGHTQTIEITSEGGIR